MILRQSSRYAALTARIAAGSADSRWYTRRGHPTSSGGLVTLIACWVWIPSGGLLVLALSNGYMALAQFEAAPAPLPRCPSTRASCFLRQIAKKVCLGLRQTAISGMS
eukprot:COSAG01_NODE_13262_length_1610_cov_13.282594_1_plen_108_part_00